MIHITASLLITGALLASSSATQSNATLRDDGFSLHLLADPKALCLDGSPGGFYFRPGVAQGASTWLLEMEGGGWCTSVSDCQGRAKTAIGSSKSWPPTGIPGMDGGANGMLSSDCAKNPHFCNATGVHMNYAVRFSREGGPARRARVTRQAHT